MVPSSSSVMSSYCCCSCCGSAGGDDGLDLSSSMSTGTSSSSRMSPVSGGDGKVVVDVVGSDESGRCCGGGGGDDGKVENSADNIARTSQTCCKDCCCSQCSTSSFPPTGCCRRNHHKRRRQCCLHHTNTGYSSCSSEVSKECRGDRLPGTVLPHRLPCLQLQHHRHQHTHNHHQQKKEKRTNFHHDSTNSRHRLITRHGLPPHQQQQERKERHPVHNLSSFVTGFMMKQNKSNRPTSTNAAADSTPTASASTTAAMLRLSTMLLLALTMSSVLSAASCSSPSFPDELDPPDKELHYDLMVTGGYNALVKPSGGPNNQLTVKMGLRLSQVLDVDEQNQIITISVWLRQEWFDRRLQWDPSNYRGVRHLNIPSDDLWKPDIVLYNNADGDFVVVLKTKATVHYNGKIVWEPPAIYKSYCPIDVEFFPFDIQECFVKFSSWTYHGGEVDLQHVCNGTMVDDSLIIPRGIDMKDYYYNVEWDVLNVSARRNVKYYPCCDDPYPDITFTITLRRRILFYTLNLIMPCISISCLAVLVFYLPSDSAEKIALSISILLALTVFFLLLSEMTPPTSLVIPLIGKYLLFIMIVVTASIFLTVFTLHINFKAPTTDIMSPWVKRIFTEILPKVLLMKRPESAKGIVLRPVIGSEEFRTAAGRPANGIEVSPDEEGEEYECLRRRHESGESTGSSGCDESAADAKLPTEVKNALKGVRYIANHFKRGDVELSEERDWKYISMVIDRFFLYIFTSACLVGTLTIFMCAPSLYDPRNHLALVDPNSTCQY